MVLNSRTSKTSEQVSISLLTGGSDRPYVFGLCKVLLSIGVHIELIGSDELIFPEFEREPALKFLNLRGSQKANASVLAKILRILVYYFKLVRYAASAKPQLFHILWNNRFEYFDRTLLMMYYKSLGKKVLFTAHNVNANKRDGKDSWLNQRTLRMQYQLSDCIFVHTEKMKLELLSEFGIEEAKVIVIPFGINNAVPNTSLSTKEAKQRLGLAAGEKTLLFFGRITPYKGVEFLVDAFRKLLSHEPGYRLIIAGRVDRAESYWSEIRNGLADLIGSGRVLVKDQFIPDEDTELYFKAADALVLPYKNIYQSGVLFLSHSFGLPVLAADVGSLTDDIVPGETGFAFRPQDVDDLARVIRQYFASDLYKNLDSRRSSIQEFARKIHSWDIVGETTLQKYSELLQRTPSGNLSDSSLDVTIPS
jgi:D-inositol-3-phosphate glycosyltransferase